MSGALQYTPVYYGLKINSYQERDFVVDYRLGIVDIG